MDVRGKIGLAVVVMLALAGAGCSSSKSKSEEPAPNRNVSAGGANGPGIDLNCVYESIQNPTESFHYSYNKQSSNPVKEEADITPQTIDGSFTNGGGTQPVHGTRADQQSWRGALAGLMGISGMSSTIALVHSGNALKREGNEKMNGYDTTRYSIDTARGDSAEQGLFRATLGSGGFEKGDAWVTDKGCPVKIELDTESHNNDGSVDKIHYSEAMVRK
ncbi:MAG TPA: hypothetical protein VL382_01235 [Terriglobales bacterium]|nr:hypothetical protein [Terriglobales bacterium]